MTAAEYRRQGRSKQLMILGLCATLLGLLEVGTGFMGLSWLKANPLEVLVIEVESPGEGSDDAAGGDERSVDDAEAEKRTETRTIKLPDVRGEWLSLNLKVHLLFGTIVFVSGIGLLLMREWGRRGLILHALMSSLWAIMFALVSTTWVVATWESSWNEADGGGAVNTGGVGAFVICSAALLWLIVAAVVVWILSRPQTRVALNLHDRGLAETR